MRPSVLLQSAVGAQALRPLFSAPWSAAPWVWTATAHAVPDPTAPGVDARAECESVEFGGVFVTDVQNGVPRSVCQYIVEGQFYYDTFENGAYLGTSVYRDGATVPIERPVIPEPFNIPQGLPLTAFQGPS